MKKNDAWAVSFGKISNNSTVAHAFLRKFYLKLQIEVSCILWPHKPIYVNLQLRALFRTSFTLQSENILSGCRFLYVFDKRRKFLANRFFAHCFIQIWQIWRCAHVSDLASQFRKIYTKMANFKMCAKQLAQLCCCSKSHCKHHTAQLSICLKFAPVLKKLKRGRNWRQNTLRNCGFAWICRGKFLAICFCAHRFPKIWQIWRCLHVSDLTSQFRKIYTKMTNFKMSAHFCPNKPI